MIGRVLLGKVLADALQPFGEVRRLAACDLAVHQHQHLPVAEVGGRMVYRFKVRDGEHIPADGAALLVCNHVGFLNPARDGELGESKNGVMRLLATHPVPVVPLAPRNLWGSSYARDAARTAPE